MSEKVIVVNRRARHDYEVLDTIEAGIALVGTEVKSLRATSGLTLKDSFADVRKGELFLVGAHIRPYDQGNINNHDPERPRKLLLHRHEIDRLAQKAAEKGLTIIPLRVYFKRGKVKVLLGMCRGKHTYDKRAALREKQADRETDRAIRSLGKG